MNIQEQIKAYLSAQSEPKHSEMIELHGIIQELMPKCQLWFLDGKDEKGKVVSNPSIGYGLRTIEYANGKTKPFYQIGLSANTTGISIYILGIEDKKHLADRYAQKIGKASITGYCIKYKTLKAIHVNVLRQAIQDGVEQTRLQP